MVFVLIPLVILPVKFTAPQRFLSCSLARVTFEAVENDNMWSSTNFIKIKIRSLAYNDRVTSYRKVPKV